MKLALIAAAIICLSFSTPAKKNPGSSTLLTGTYDGVYTYYLNGVQSKVDAHFKMKVSSLGNNKYQVAKISDDLMPDFKFVVTSTKGFLYNISIPSQKTSLIGQIKGNGTFIEPGYYLSLNFSRWGAHGAEASISLVMQMIL